MAVQLPKTSINDLFGIPNSKLSTTEMTTKEILLSANMMLAPYDLSNRSQRGASYMIDHLYDFDALTKQMNDRGMWYIDDQTVLKQKKKIPTYSWMRIQAK